MESFASAMDQYKFPVGMYESVYICHDPNFKQEHQCSGLTYRLLMKGGEINCMRYAASLTVIFV